MFSGHFVTISVRCFHFDFKYILLESYSLYGTNMIPKWENSKQRAWEGGRHV